MVNDFVSGAKDVNNAQMPFLSLERDKILSQIRRVQYEEVEQQLLLQSLKQDSAFKGDFEGYKQ